MLIGRIGRIGEKMTDKAAKIVEVAKSLVGKSCYVWGARGENMSSMANVYDWVLRMETADGSYTKPQNAYRVMRLYDRLSDKGIIPVRGFDCSGLVYYVYSKAGAISVRRTAESYFSRCTEIQHGDLKAGDLVFRHNGTKISHVGIYIGNGMVIHAKGRDLGVVEEKIGAYKWNKYGRVDGVQELATYDTTANNPYVLVLGDTVNLRSAPGKEGTVVVGVATKGLKMDYLETDKKTGWYKVRYGLNPVYITNMAKYTKLVNPNEKG